jgi:nitroreductase
MTALLAPTRPSLALVADAVRAPSSHNSQPWLFRVEPGRVELHADRTRALPVNDPLDRELTISCGAALTNLVAAAAHHHFSTSVELLPDEHDADHLATVRLAPAPAYSDARIAYGIRLRGTWRGEFTPRPVPEDLIDEMAAAAAVEGAWVRIVSERRRPELVELVARGDHLQFDDPHWRRELASWMHPRRSGDGLPRPLVQVPVPVQRFVVSHRDLGDRVARADAAVTAKAPLVLVLGTDADDEQSWLTAGRALQRLLLTAAVVGVQAGFSNQPCQVPSLRPQLAELVGRGGPQMVLRLGYPPEHPTPSPRRPVHEVVLPD